MKLEEQVVSLELAKKLKKLGVPQDSLWYWINGELYCSYCSETGDIPLSQEEYSAFTVAELIVRLPESVEINKLIYWFRIEKYKNKYACGYCLVIRESGESGEDITYHKEIDSIMVDAVAKMLIYLLENKIIKVGGLK